MTIIELLRNAKSLTPTQFKLIKEALTVLLNKDEDEFESDEAMFAEAETALATRIDIQTLEDLFALDLRQVLETLEAERSGESAEIAKLLIGESLDMDERKHTTTAAQDYRDRLQYIIQQFAGIIDEKALKQKLFKISSELVLGTELGGVANNRFRK
jgi:hypothetical protein